MRKLPLLYGYAGILPVAMCMGVLIMSEHTGQAYIPKPETFLVLSIYTSLILSFLTATHWLPGIKRNCALRVSYSMTGALTGLLVNAVLIVTAFSYLFLLIPLHFVIAYFMDRALLTENDIPDGYLTFRSRLTLIICTMLVISYVYVI